VVELRKVNKPGRTVMLYIHILLCLIDMVCICSCTHKQWFYLAAEKEYSYVFSTLDLLNHAYKALCFVNFMCVLK
jgi:predicted metal-binding protein